MSITNKNLEEIQSLLPKLPAPPEGSLPEGATPEAIDAFESRTKLIVSNKFRAWLQISNGPCVGAGGVFGIKPARSDLDIEYLYELFPEWQRKGWIPIGGDGCGNYYIIATKGEYGSGEPVLFIDTMDDKDAPTFIVASDVLRFLCFYFKKELNLTTWPFNKKEVTKYDPEITLFQSVLLPWEADD